jgi:phosphoribosyl-ATP pyrophosphohydrolase
MLASLPTYGREMAGKKGRRKTLEPLNRRHVLELLYEHVKEDKRTHRVGKRRREQIAKKVGEEAVETVIEGLRGDRLLLILESADLLYYLMALWSVNEVEPDAVWSEVAQRIGARQR